MTRAFAYIRTSTVEQSLDSQIHEIKNAGFAIEPYRIVSDMVSGDTRASSRPGFSLLLVKLEPGDVLIVTKLDRLGRNAIDVAMTIQKLDELGVGVYCLSLGGVDLNSPAGKLVMHVLGAVAQFERDLIVERTRAGMDAARARGARIGRPRVLTVKSEKLVSQQLSIGRSISAIARDFRISRQTVMRVRQKMAPKKSPPVAPVSPP